MFLPKRDITLHIHLSIRSLIYLFVVFVVFVYLFISADSARAAISNASRIIPFQGTLTNSSGNYVADGNYSIVFAIYTVASGGTAAWSETDTVATTNGAFSVNIGANDANGVNLAMDTPPYYLGIKVGANAEMSPRVQLAFSPFAMTAKGVDPSAIPAGSPTGMVSFFNLASCPSGWTELTAARGMTIVGLPLSGTLAGTVGTAFTNLENRTHTHTGPSHTHGYNYGMGGPGSADVWSAATTASGTGLTGTAATSNVIPYIQLLACQKS